MAQDLKYVIVPGQWPEQKMKPLYQEVYRCWQDTWSDAFTELGKPPGFLKSDTFTRQDFVGGIFLGDRCVALSFFRWADPTLPTFSSDSYFSNWGETHIRKLRAHGDRIIICSNFTIAKEARRTAAGFSMKDLLVAITLKTFLHTGADALTGALRRDRHVNEACARWGGVEIAREVASGHGDTVDLMGFYHDVIAKHPRQDLSDLVDSLWEARTAISNFRPVKVDQYAA
jgi:hypothetical protein